ncbi:hypothetical protein FRC06_010997 [Ceratobasidium sp. 370]|nr:hypothetical protein FRC06_010997 [Ceratobasidium sp. 370]
MLDLSAQLSVLTTTELDLHLTPAGSQYTYVYEVVPHDAFIKWATKKLNGANLEGRSTKDIVAMVEQVEKDQASQVGPSQRSPEIKLLPPSAARVGGGWHLNRITYAGPSDTNSQGEGSRPGKRGSESLETINSQPAKRQQTAPADNTDTEPESDDYVIVHPSPPPAPAPANRTAPSQRHPRLASTPLHPQTGPGTLAPPPTHNGTPTTVLDSPRPSAQPSRSHSLGGSLSCNGTPDSLPLLPSLQFPVRDTAHKRLRAKVLTRAVDQLEKMLERVEHAEGEEGEIVEETDAEVDTSGPLMNEDEGEEGEPNVPSSTSRNTHNKKTYRKRRSHLPSAPDDLLGAIRPQSRLNSTSTGPARLLGIGWVQAVMEPARAEANTHSAIPRHTRIEQARPYPRPPLSTEAQAGSAASRREPRQENRRLDPVSAARADLVAFNNEIAQQRATSFMESATRANRRRGDGVGQRSGPMLNRDRPADGLLDDDEELLAQAQAFAAGQFPKPARSRRCRNRKKKPLARDSIGLSRQVLVVAKIHLFAYALMEGIYQTRDTSLRWAQDMHLETWNILLPELPYVAALESELEVMVNYLATLRGKVKERLRALIAEIHTLRHRISSEEDIQHNLDAYNLAYPNSFHCTSQSPRRGHYESPHIPRLIGAAFFYGPTSVGVQFPQYFEEMPLTIVAFVLAVWQFCLEEWLNGWFESHELGTSHMLDKYEAHLAGLKELRAVAPRRLHRLQDEWSAYVKQVPYNLDYSGATFVRKHAEQTVTQQLELRVDSPVPEELDYNPEEERLFEQYEEEERLIEQYEEEQQLLDEREEQMMEEVCIMSLEQAVREHEARVATPTNDNAPTPHNVSSRSPSPAPTVEYREDGRLTTRSKGKGRAN